MQDLTYRNTKDRFQQLFIEKLSIDSIANVVKTPFYCYSKQNLINNFHNFVAEFNRQQVSDYQICYAIKANQNLHIASIFAKLGAGIDAVSIGEIERAICVGTSPEKIIFAGVGKTFVEIESALKLGVHEFSVESQAELFMISQVAAKIGKIAKFSLRVNPDIDAKTHSNISTGRKGDKFGVDIELAEEIYLLAKHLPAIEIHGISMHIGSQITTIEPFRKAFAKMADLAYKLKNHNIEIKQLDFGGGIGVFYKDEVLIDLKEYISLIKETAAKFNAKIVIAPGRSLVASAGMLVSSVILLKNTGDKNFTIIDASMNDLARPGLYGSYHEVLPCVKDFSINQEAVLTNLAGPVCESTDVLAKSRLLPPLNPNDLLVFLTAGAYGSAMSSQYNCRPLIPEVLVDGEDFKIIRRRPSFLEMISLENFH